MADIKVDTRFGELSIDPSRIITFPRGIPGFEDSTRWTLFHEIDAQGGWASGVVVYLQSLDEGDVALPLTDPTLFGFNFDLVLSDSELSELKIEDPSDVLVLTTLSLKDPAASKTQRPSMADMYANISAPILINTRSRIGMQKALIARESRVDFHSVS